MNSQDQEDSPRENDHLVEPMYGGLEVAPEPRQRPPVIPLFIGFALGIAILLIWLFVFEA